MNISRNKAVTLVTIILLSLMITSIFAVDVSAHNPSLNIRTWTRVAVAPDPVGVNQKINIVSWLTQAPPGGANDASVRWQFNVAVTSPTNVTTSLGTVYSDANGYASTIFTPTATGTWTVTVTFPQTFYNWSTTTDEQVYTNDIFLTSTYSSTFTVQTAPVAVSTTPLPSETQQSSDWFQLTGSGCLGTGIPTTIGGTTGRCEADAPVIGPSTAHVLWTRPLEAGGIVGGSNVGVPGDQYFTGSSYWMRYQTTGIMNGYFYYTNAAGSTGATGNLNIIDLRDGHLVRQSGTGSLNPGYSCNGVNVLLSTGTTYTATDPATLTTAAWSITSVPSGTTIIGEHGERLVLSFTSTGSNITEWNSSRVIVPGLTGATSGGFGKYFDFNVTTTMYNSTTGTWDPFIIPSTYRNILNAYRNDKLICSNTISAGYSNNSMTFFSVNMKPGHQGQIISNYTFYQRSSTAGHYVNARMVDPINNVVCVAYRELCAWRGCNLNNGQIYDSAPQAQFDFFGYLPNLALGTEHDMDGWAAYGHLYSAQYGGILYCYNTSDMSLLWTYGNQPLTDKLGIPNATALGVGGVYARAPTFIGGIADGKVYTFASEHSINTPIYKGAKVRCVDAYTGAELFTIDTWNAMFTGVPAFTPPAYGYLIYLNSYDQQIYALAKGPSATTVSTSPQVTQGNTVIIKGTVMDASAGTNQTGIVSRFPYGCPAVADVNMSVWMEYVYMQRPHPDNILGVNVTLSAIAPDGSITDIGTATSDSTGYYDFLWTPPSSGAYTILASFTGTKSYYPSYAQSSFSVTGASQPTFAPTAPPAPATDSYIMDFTVVTIAVMTIAGVAILLMLRRRP